MNTTSGIPTSGQISRPAQIVLQARRNRSEAFEFYKLIPANLRGYYQDQIDKINEQIGWRKYRIVTR